jgi:hypothetical protein
VESSREGAEFAGMVERLKAWSDRYYDCIVPRKVPAAAAAATTAGCRL